jgi:acylphosphatase
MVTRQIRVRGRVQGVGFRYSLRDEATRLRLAGWVRNRLDGSVEALAQGDATAVDALVAWARRGPRGARVDGLDIETPPDPQSVEGFAILPSA